MSDFYKVACSFLFAFGIGFVCTQAILPTPVVVPMPTVAPPDRDLVVGLSEVLVDVHKEAVATRKELAGVKAEARQIISAMIQEIERLQTKPTVKPGMTVAVESIDQKTKGKNL